MLAPTSVAFERDGTNRPIEVGSGAFCKVLRAKFSKETVAVKELKREWVDDPRAMELFRREIELGFSLSHPHICRVYGAWLLYLPEQGVYPSVVMEYLPLRLTDVFRNPDRYPKFTSVVLHAAFQDIADTLVFLHHHRPPIYHLDLKPDNVMLSASYKVKLVDFGLAKIERGSHMSRRTVSKGVSGTAGYIVCALLCCFGML